MRLCRGSDALRVCVRGGGVVAGGVLGTTSLFLCVRDRQMVGAAHGFVRALLGLHA